MDRKNKTDTLDEALRKQREENRDLKEKLELFEAGVFQGGAGLGMRLDNVERECKAFGERVDLNIVSMGTFEVETRTLVEKEFQKTQSGVNVVDQKVWEAMKKAEEAKKRHDKLLEELNQLNFLQK